MALSNTKNTQKTQNEMSKPIRNCSI